MFDYLGLYPLAIKSSNTFLSCSCCKNTTSVSAISNAGDHIFALFGNIADNIIFVSFSDFHDLSSLSRAQTVK